MGTQPRARAVQQQCVRPHSLRRPTLSSALMPCALLCAPSLADDQLRWTPRADMDAANVRLVTVLSRRLEMLVYVLAAHQGGSARHAHRTRATRSHMRLDSASAATA